MARGTVSPPTPPTAEPIETRTVAAGITSFAPPSVIVKPSGISRVDIDECQYLTQRLLSREHGRVWLRRDGDYYAVIVRTAEGEEFRKRSLFLHRSRHKHYEQAARQLIENPLIMYRMFGPRPAGDGSLPNLGPYDGVWFPTSERGHNRLVQTDDFFFRKTDYVSPADYRFTLNTEDDPETFLKLAKLYYSAGIYNTSEFENRINAQLKEVITARAVRKVTQMLEEAKYEDLINGIHSYRALLNRTLQKLPAEIKSPIRTVVDCAPKVPEWFSIGPTSYYTEPLNKFQFVYKKNLSIDTQKKLLKTLMESEAVLRANLNKFEHQLLILSTPQAPFERHPDMEDPANNPYLVWNPEESARRNEVIFENVARNKNIAYRNVPKYTAGGSRWSLDVMEKTPEFRESQRRYYDPETGKVYGGGGEDEKKESILPWVAGGILAAYGVSQVI